MTPHRVERNGVDMARHPIARFLKTEKLSVSALARRADVSRTSLQKVLTGDRNRLDADACLRLSAATNGSVTVVELLQWKGARARAQCRPLHSR